jgi:hypothetical protein
MLYSFSLCEFLLEGFSHKAFNETTCVMQLMNVMYSFLQKPFFPIGFSDGVFNEAYPYRGNRPRESVIKHTYSKGEGGILILVRLYVVSYQTLRPWQDYIYVVPLCYNHQYLEEQRIVSLFYVYLFVYFYLLC